MTKSYYNFTSMILLFIFTSLSLGSEKIKLTVDIAQFKSDSDKNYLEIYYAIKQSDLSFVSNDEDRNSAQALVNFKIYHEDSLWVNQAWRVPTYITDSTEITEANNIVDVIRYQLIPGAYQLVAQVQDLNDLAKLDSVILDFELSEFSNSKISLSDIQLASSMKKSEKDMENDFYKNSLEVIPNPSGIYGARLPMLYYYVEAYNLNSGEISNKYKTKCFVSNPEGDRLGDMYSRQQNKIKIGDTSVEVGVINIAPLQTGSYHLNFIISDETGRPLDSVKKKFYAYNSIPTAKEAEISKIDDLVALSSFGRMDKNELDKEFAYIQYIIKKEGADFYKNLTNIDAKRKFLFTFWQRRDPSPGTIFNEYRQDYLQKVRVASEKFKAFGREGWHTDRGRVYILYGPPDIVEPFHYTRDTKPYEIWTYYNIAGEGAAEFVFADITNFRDYRLLHSNKRGEIKNENWYNLIVEHAN